MNRKYVIAIAAVATAGSAIASDPRWPAPHASSAALWRPPVRVVQVAGDRARPHPGRGEEGVRRRDQLLPGEGPPGLGHQS